MFGQKGMLAERAALNGIDLSPFSGYPPETVKRILQALENGRSMKRMKKLAAYGKNLEEYLDSDTVKDDIPAFTEELLASGQVPEHAPDLRSLLCKWDMILPADSCFGWSTNSIRFTKERLQHYIDENEPAPGKNTPLFLRADAILDGGNKTPRPGAGRPRISDIFNVEEATEEPVPHYSIRDAEYLACYMVLSGHPTQRKLTACGEAAAAAGLDSAGIYKCMLEAAAVAVMVESGIRESMSYYDANKSRIRYHIHETGFFKKRMIAEEIIEKGTLFRDLATAMVKTGDPVEAILQSGAGHNGLALWHAVMEYSGDARLKSGISADREKQLYAKEIYHFLEKERRNG